MPFTFNAISYRAASSKTIELAPLLPGGRAASLPDLDHDRIPATAAVDVSMPRRGLHSLAARGGQGRAAGAAARRRAPPRGRASPAAAGGHGARFEGAASRHGQRAAHGGRAARNGPAHRRRTPPPGGRAGGSARKRHLFQLAGRGAAPWGRTKSRSHGATSRAMNAPSRLSSTSARLRAREGTRKPSRAASPVSAPGMRGSAGSSSTSTRPTSLDSRAKAMRHLKQL